MISVITIRAFDKVNVFSIQNSTLPNFNSPYFLDLWKTKGDSNINTFIDNLLRWLAWLK